MEGKSQAQGAMGGSPVENDVGPEELSSMSQKTTERFDFAVSTSGSSPSNIQDETRVDNNVASGKKDSQLTRSAIPMPDNCKEELETLTGITTDRDQLLRGAIKRVTELGKEKVEIAQAARSEFDNSQKQIHHLKLQNFQAKQRYRDLEKQTNLFLRQNSKIDLQEVQRLKIVEQQNIQAIEAQQCQIRELKEENAKAHEKISILQKEKDELQKSKAEARLEIQTAQGRILELEKEKASFVGRMMKITKKKWELKMEEAQLLESYTETVLNNDGNVVGGGGKSRKRKNSGYDNDDQGGNGNAI